MRVETQNVTKRFGGVIGLDDVSVEFPSGSVTAVIGPNGAGKTTLFSVISGFQHPDSGSVLLFSEGDPQGASGFVAKEIAGRDPERIARDGLGILFQDVRVFKRLSALENVMIGFKRQQGESPLRCIAQPRKVRHDDRETNRKATGLLEFVGLEKKAALWAGNLSYGEQKLVGLARLLAADTRVLLLDEPTAGVHPLMATKLLSLVSRLAKEKGCAVAMIEHNLNVVRDTGNWVYLMAGGKIEVFGEPKEVLRDESLQRLYPTL
jgi:ABC-type branched-subunit amino acid transport system ATPase component